MTPGDQVALSWTPTEGPGFSLRLNHPDPEAVNETVAGLIDDRVASRLFAGDPTLWGPDSEEEASKRLGWVDLHDTSRALVAQITALRDELRGQGIEKVVLCGMGGSSLAPEVICQGAGKPLRVLDSSSPDVVRRAVHDDLAATVVVVSSKSGGTVETDSQRRIFDCAFRAAGIDPANRIVVVTDPGSPLERDARAAGHRVFLADPEVGGRYSALSAFGLVPSGLAGVDLDELLTDAATIAPALARDEATNPALALGVVLGLAARAGVDKLVLAEAGAPFSELGIWAEQLIAESTGKEGTGILPIAVGDTTKPNVVPSTTDTVVATWGPNFVLDVVAPASGIGVAVDAGLGAQFLLWEAAVAVAGRILEINPFDQPDVESSKEAARHMLGGTVATPAPRGTSNAIDIYAGSWLETVTDTDHAVAALLDQIDPAHGYLAVQAYLDAERDADVARLRDLLAARTGRPVTFGWGPRFLHSTGQYHKGGPATGVFLQLTCEPEADLEVPGREFTLQQFITAQAIGDGQILSRRGRPVLRLHAQRPGGFNDVVRALR
ncbi:glucose-6-phosphate isomerase [Nocardioides sp. Bht2]|uniref:glucose-6-phosphate isomerase n=1 Tax=Nocardioides sp. Bht2 TaxID=3392297 RepID=UPI0039B4EC7A